MKSFAVFATVAALTWSTATQAQVAPIPSAYVNFTSAQGQPFSLLLDGQVMTNPVARQVRLGQLTPGRHWADFSLATGYGQPVRFRTTVWLEPGVETNYILVMQPYGPRLQRMGAVAVNGPVYGSVPGQAGGYAGTYPTPMQPGNYPAPAQQGNYPAPAQPDNYPTPTQPGTYQGPPNSYPDPTPNNGTAPYGGNTAGRYPAPATQPGTYQPDTQPAPDEQQAPMPDTTTNNALPPLPANEVDKLTQQLHNRPSDGARLTIAKEALAQHSVQAEELAQLLSTFILDKSRIDLAEYGYEHVSDPENFAVVYEVFHLPASVQTVQQALGLPGQ